MTPERKAELLKGTREAMTMTGGTADKATAAVYLLAEVVEVLVLEIVPEVKR